MLPLTSAWEQGPGALSSGALSSGCSHPLTWWEGEGALLAPLSPPALVFRQTHL